MYSERIVKKTLDDFARREGWRPEPHSIDEVDEFIEYINGIVTIDSNSVNDYFEWKSRPTEKRIQWIKRWIENEQYMCFADASYFMTRYAHFCDVEDNIYRYSPRKSQDILHSFLAEMDEEQMPIELFILKARQLGFSTAVALYFSHRLLFRPNTRAVMASVKHTQSELIGRMQETCWKKLPFWLPPAQVTDKKGTREWSNGSILSIQSGSQSFGIAQGWSPSCIHISEIGDIPNPQKVLEEGLFRAAHSTRNLFFVLEGTGNRGSGWQYEKWKYYKANWGNGGRFLPFFVPPPCAPDIYPPNDWIRKHPIPENFHPLEETIRMKRRAELFIRETPYLWKVMGQRFELPKEYLWYWDANWREAIATNTEKIWLAQMPCTDDEAFQSKEDTVFKPEVIDVITGGREKVYKAYAITGRSIVIGSDDQLYYPPEHEIDYDEPRIKLRWIDPEEKEYKWELIPLKPFDDSDDSRCFNKLLMFQAPEDNREYVTGIDTAHGLGVAKEDRSTVSVHIVRYGAERDEQVASFTSLHVNSAQMSRIAAAIATLYTTDWNCEITSSNALGMRFIIEQVRKSGDECMLALKLMGFMDHHKFHFYDEAGIPNPNKGNRGGWRTGTWSRSYLLEKFVNAVNGGWIKLNDPIVIRQLATFVRKDKGQGTEMTHDSGQHDDNIFAAAMAYLTAHDMENEAARMEMKYKPKEIRQAEVDARWASNSVQIM